VGKVMVGGNPAAREDAYRQTTAFLSPFLKTPSAVPASAAREGKVGDALSAQELRRTISGNTLKFRLPNSGKNASIYFAEDGRAVTKIEGRKMKMAKTWSIDGMARLCRTYGKENRQHCTSVRNADEAGRLELWNDKLRYEAKLSTGSDLPE